MPAAALAALLPAWLFYRRAFAALGPQRWRTLFLLRAGAILAVIVLLFRPAISYQKHWTERQAIIFLLDASESMKTADAPGDRSRFEVARERLEKWSAALRSDFRPLIVAFADGAVPLENLEELRTLVPDGRATSLDRALAAAARQCAPAEVAAVVLISDGIHNLGGDPVAAAQKTGLRVDCIGVGSSLRNNPDYRDVQVLGIECPDRLPLGNLARVGASIEAVGLGGRVVRVMLDEDQRQVAETELTLDDVAGPQSVRLEFRPESPGRRVYTVRVQPVEGERIVENNQRSAAALVVKPGIRVLYIEGTLRAEYGALVDRLLARDPDLEFTALVQTRPGVFLRRSNSPDPPAAAIPADQAAFDRFDVFLIGDLDASFLGTDKQQMLLNRVRAGAGAAMLGGYHGLGPGGYDGTPLGNAMPVELGPRSIGQYTEPFLPTLTPEGARHPIFANIAEFFPTRQSAARQPGLPPLDGCTRLGAARPAATVLATLGAVEAAMPVLAVQPFGNGRTAVFAADTTRNWQQVPLALDRQSPFVRFWGQLIRWLAGRDEAVEARAGVSIDTDRLQYDAGQQVRVSAVIRDQQGQAAAGAAATAVVKGPGGRSARVPLGPAASGGAGHYSGEFRPWGAGRYDIMVEAKIGETPAASETLPVTVGRTNLEFEKLDLDERMLAAIAAAGGGQYVPLAAADHLIQQIDRGGKQKSARVQQRLDWPPLWWTLLATALTTEWILRRQYRLR